MNMELLAAASLRHHADKQDLGAWLRLHEALEEQGLVLSASSKPGVMFVSTDAGDSIGVVVEMAWDDSAFHVIRLADEHEAWFAWEEFDNSIPRACQALAYLLQTVRLGL